MAVQIEIGAMKKAADWLRAVQLQAAASSASEAEKEAMVAGLRSAQALLTETLGQSGAQGTSGASAQSG